MNPRLRPLNPRWHDEGGDVVLFRLSRSLPTYRLDRVTFDAVLERFQRANTLSVLCIFAGLIGVIVWINDGIAAWLAACWASFWAGSAAAIDTSARRSIRHLIAKAERSPEELDLSFGRAFSITLGNITTRHLLQMWMLLVALAGTSVWALIASFGVLPSPDGKAIHPLIAGPSAAILGALAWLCYLEWSRRK